MQLVTRAHSAPEAALLENKEELIPKGQDFMDT